MLRRLEIAANISIICVSILLSVVLVKKFLLTPSHQQKTLSPGNRVTVPGVDWSANGTTMLVALRKGCPLCADSAPFYRTLVVEAQANGVRTMVLLEGPLQDVQEYLKTLDVAFEQVQRVRLDTIPVAGVPLVALVNSQGIATRVWSGRLEPRQEAEVLTSVRK